MLSKEEWYSSYRELFDPIEKTGKGFYGTGLLLTAGVAIGVYCYLTQFVWGLGVTGMAQPISWGFYVINFVFFIGISHAGTLISAILRLCKAEWRRPVTRMAEVITVMVISIGGMNILVDLGRPDRLLNVIYYGRYQSPLLWDATSITTYLVCSCFYLYVPLIPDIAILRDRGKKYNFFYTVLSLGWRGTPGQHKVLNRVIMMMAILVIPIAVSVHTVVSFVFSMTIQPMWHSTIFGPYFVVGAIFSGIAGLLISMAVLRKAFKLERILKPVHFSNLALLMLVMSLLWLYFTFAEYLTAYYGNEPDEMAVWWSKFSGPYAIPFWTMFTCNFIIPIAILPFKKFRTIPGIVIASIAVVVGMFLERFIIVVPTLANPRLPLGIGSYMPSVYEWGELLGCFSLFALFYLIFTKFFPIISMAEIEEGRQDGLNEIIERFNAYQPESIDGKAVKEESRRNENPKAGIGDVEKLKGELFPPMVSFLQHALMVGFSIFCLSVIVWISHLVNISRYWKDAPSASIGISLVAIPIYLFVLGVFHYLYWGLRRNIA